MKYLYTPTKTSKYDEWIYFANKFKALLQSIQGLIVKKSHGCTKLCCIQHRTVLINI